MSGAVTEPIYPAGDAAVVAIIESLSVNSGLEMLLIAENPFGDETGPVVVNTLCKKNTTLRVLDIHGSRMSIDTEKQVQPTICFLESIDYPTTPLGLPCDS